MFGSWMDIEMRRSTARSKKDNAGLAGGLSSVAFERLAAQQRIANQLTLHQVRCQLVGYSMLTIF